MLQYLGTELLDEIRGTYAERLRLARERGYGKPESKYHWLYAELDYRSRFLRQALLFLNSLPKFMTGEDADKPMLYVVSYTTGMFTEASIGDAAFNSRSPEKFFDSSNGYWRDMEEALTLMGDGYDFTNLPLYYTDLCEYTVRCVRLHLYIREKAYHAIDREKFVGLVHFEPPADEEGGAA